MPNAHSNPSVSADVRAFGVALAASRKLRGMTQAQLADAAGVGRRVVVHAEGGKGVMSLDSALRLMAVLGARITFPAELPSTLVSLERR